MGVGGMGQRSRESLAISESSILDGSYNTCRRTCLERGLWGSWSFWWGIYRERGATEILSKGFIRLDWHWGRVNWQWYVKWIEVEKKTGSWVWLREQLKRSTQKLWMEVLTARTDKKDRWRRGFAEEATTRFNTPALLWEKMKHDYFIFPKSALASFWWTDSRLGSEVWTLGLLIGRVGWRTGSVSRSPWFSMCFNPIHNFRGKS